MYFGRFVLFLLANKYYFLWRNSVCQKDIIVDGFQYFDSFQSISKFFIDTRKAQLNYSEQEQYIKIYLYFIFVFVQVRYNLHFLILIQIKIRIIRADINFHKKIIFEISRSFISLAPTLSTLNRTLNNWFENRNKKISFCAFFVYWNSFETHTHVHCC